MTLLEELRGFRTMDPLWWRVPVWGVMIGYTVSQANGPDARIAAGVLMGVSVVALQLIRVPNLAAQRVAVLVAIVLGLAACYAAPKGIAEIPPVVAIARLPNFFEGRPLRWLVIVTTIAFAVTVAVISGSASGLLAGVGVPMLVQRSLEQRELIRERDRAQALLAEAQRVRESDAETAALQERGRIAREMHDVLAHSLAGLSVQLQGVRAVAAREGVPASVLDPLDKAAALAKVGLTEARAAVGALRDPVGLGLAELPALVDRHPGHATLSSSGVAGEVPPETGHAIYRAVQESLTNAARYAPGSPVTVQVQWASTLLTVQVSDDGAAPGREAVGGQGTGLGLAGMAERIRQAGGSLQAGPRPEGGWMIDIEVPVAATAVSA